MLFLETTPDTSGYMIAGYAIAIVIMILYSASLAIRWRKRKDRRERVVYRHRDGGTNFIRFHHHRLQNSCLL